MNRQLFSKKAAARLKELDLKAAESPEHDFFSLTEDEQEEYFQLTAMERAAEHYDKLPGIMDEAEERVWYNRNPFGWSDTAIDPSTLDGMKVSEETIKQVIEYKKAIEEKYGVCEEDVDDFYHGYWSGILALSRYLSGYFDDESTDLVTGEGLLDT